MRVVYFSTLFALLASLSVAPSVFASEESTYEYFAKKRPSVETKENWFPDSSYVTPNSKKPASGRALDSIAQNALGRELVFTPTNKAQKVIRSKRLKSIEEPDTKTIPLNEIYDFEKRLVDQFSAARDETRKSEVESRDTLGKCFEQLLAISPLKTRYVKIVRDNHVFFVPNVFQDLDEAQLARLKQGKMFVSPNKGRSFNGHHIEMRDPTDENACPVIYITATTHQKFSKDWHLEKKLRGSTQVSRNKFASAKRKAVKAIDANLNK